MDLNPDRLKADRHKQLLHVIIPFIPISTIAVVIRFWSRLIVRERLWWDDLCTLGAWACGNIVIVLGALAAHHGIGKHDDVVEATELPNVEYIQKLIYSAFIVFGIAVTFVKWAALTFYTRIFHVSSGFRLSIRICSTFTLIWLLSNLAITIFFCTPIDKFWKPLNPGHCVQLFEWQLAEAVFDVLLNLAIVALPAPMVWSLNASVRRKVMLMAAFFFGYLALIPSLGRLISTAQLGKDMQSDFYWDVVDIEWSLLEPAICVTSLCIPPCFQLLKRARVFGIKYLFVAHDPKKSASGASSITMRERLFNERLRRGGGRISSFHRLQGGSVFEAMGLGSEFVVDVGLSRELGSREEIELGEESIGVHQEVSVKMTPMGNSTAL